MTWRQAYAYCEGLPHERGSWWRLATVPELHALHGFSIYKIGAGPGPDEMWSASMPSGDSHHSVNMNNGARSWRGDERDGHVMCVKGYSALVDATSWVMELYNARLMNNGARAFAIAKRMAEAGVPGGQLELGNAYFKGEGVAQDATQARNWYQKAADQGLADARYNLQRLDSGAVYQQPQSGGNTAVPVASEEPVTPTANNSVSVPAADAVGETGPGAVAAQPAPAERAPSGTLLVLTVRTPGQLGQGTPMSVYLVPRSIEGEKIVEQSHQDLKRISLELLRELPVGSLDSKPALEALSKRLITRLNEQLGGQILGEVTVEHGEPEVG